MKYLGRGRMRMAFKVGRYVLKIPYNFNGLKACFEERQLWKKYKSKAMAPVLFSIPFLLIVMPYYPIKFEGDRPDSFIKYLNEFGIIDLHPYNVRLFEGNPIAIDYAINKTSHGQGYPTDYSEPNGYPTGHGWGAPTYEFSSTHVRI